MGRRLRRAYNRLFDSPVETLKAQLGQCGKGCVPRHAFSAEGVGAVTLARRLTTLALLAGLLGGCAHKPLEAPCSAEEDAAPIASRAGGASLPLAAFTALGPCGPMRPI